MTGIVLSILHVLTYLVLTNNPIDAQRGQVFQLPPLDISWNEAPVAA